MYPRRCIPFLWSVSLKDFLFGGGGGVVLFDFQADGVGTVAPRDAAVGEGELDMLLVEHFFDAAAELASHGPLLHGLGFDD